MIVPRVLSLAVTSVAIFLFCPGAASAAPVVTASETAASTISDCPTVPPAQTSFLPTAASVWFDAVYSGANNGDPFTTQWFEPNGSLYTSNQYTQQYGTGITCSFSSLSITGYPPANLPGTWTVKLSWYSTVIASAQFTIVPVCSSATFSLPDGWAQNYLLDGGNSYITWSFVTTPASCAWTATGDSSVQSLSPSSGTGPSTITAKFSPNNSGSVVTNKVTLKSGSATYILYATRNPSSCTLTPSPPSLSFPSAGGTRQLTISSNLSVCEWFLETPDWLSGTFDLQTGSQTVSISAGLNTSTSLSGEVTTDGVVTNPSIPVTQAAPGAVTISSLSPSNATAGGPAFTLTVNGSGFASGASVRWNSSALSTTFVNSGQLTASVPSSLIATPATAAITVVSGGTTSNSISFAVNNQQALLLTSAETAATGECPSIPPPLGAFLTTADAAYLDFTYTGGTAGDVFNIQFFDPSGALYYTGSTDPQPDSGGSYCWQSWIYLAGYDAASLPGTWTVKLLRNTTQIYSTQFAIAPVCSSFSATSAQNILVSNTAYVNWSFVTTPSFCAWTAAGDSSIQTLSATFGTGGSSITATFPPNNTTSVQTNTVSLTSGATTYTLYVTRNPNSCSFTPSPPSLNFPVAGGIQKLTVTSNLSGCLWFLDGPSWLTIPSQLLTGSQTLNITASANTGNALLGALTTYGLVSNLSIPVTQASSAAVTISSLSPVSGPAGGPGFTLTINGSGFASGASVEWNGSALSTTFVNAGQLTAFVPANLIASAGAAGIIVLSGGNTSNSVSFAINNPTLVLTSLIPASVTAGGPAFALTVNGNGFASNAAVQWSGLGLPTTFVNASQLTAAVPATLISTAGTAAIVVVSGGMTSNSLSFATLSSSPAYLIGTVAGGGQNPADGELATSAQLAGPTGMAVDSSGNLFIADSRNNRIRKVTAATGVISTVAGNANQPAGYSGDGGLATSAQLNTPRGVALDSLGNLYIADTNNYVIRMVTQGTGVITTVAGNRSPAYSGDGGQAINASLSAAGIAVDSSANLYIADSVNARIRKVTPAAGGIASGIISTVAGNGTPGPLGPSGPANSAFLNSPQGVAVDSAGNIYIADTDNSVVRKVTPSNGNITTVAGNGSYGDSGDGGPAASAELKNPVGVAVDGAGNIYVTDYVSENIRKVAAATNKITTLTGQGTNSNVSSQPSGIALGRSGQVFISDEYHGVVTLVNDSGAPTSESTPGNATTLDHLTFNLLIQNSTSTMQNQAIRGIASKDPFKENAKPRTRANLSSDSLTVGGTVAFTETLARDNASPDANNVIVSGSVPPTYIITACYVANGGQCLANGSNQVTATYPVLSSNGPPPSLTVIADGPISGAAALALSSTSGSNTLATASVSQSVELSPGPELTPAFQGPVSAISAGQTIQYVVTVSNIGGAALSGDPITATVTVDPSLTSVSVPPAPPWICTQTSSTITCTDSSGLPGGGGEARFLVNGIVPTSASKIISAQAAFMFGGQPPVNQNVSTTITGGQAPPPFFTAEATLGGGVYYLQFPNGNVFGYYTFATGSIFYHYDMGYEGFVPGSGADVYLYDFTTNHWWYTSSALFPYLYDFTLNSWIYYFPDGKNPGHYDTNPRYFSNLTTGKIFTM